MLIYKNNRRFRVRQKCTNGILGNFEQFLGIWANQNIKNINLKYENKLDKTCKNRIISRSNDFNLSI